MSIGTVHKTYDVQLDGSKYRILLSSNMVFDSLVKTLAEKTKNKKVLIVTDEFFEKGMCAAMVGCLSSAGYEVSVHPMSSGKHNKTIYEAIKIYELLEEKGFSRDSTLIALGGGVIGDLSGFVASTYLRGMNFINVPTTLMAMIDSSIGGKVAINFRKTINAIGNYYHPMLNVLDFDFVRSLSDRDFKSGLAEIIKCAIINDAVLLDYLDVHVEKILERDEAALLHIMSRAIEIKLDHVSGDVKEQGVRLKLNYGHTLGHAVEVSTDVLGEVYRHGEGVAIGMVGAAFLAQGYFDHNGDVLRAHENILTKYGLPIRVDAKNIHFDPQDLMKACLENVYKDKKKKGSKLRFVLVEKIGKCGVYHDVSDDAIVAAFKYLIEGAR